jgi:hypothetical protein
VLRDGTGTGTVIPVKKLESIKTFCRITDININDVEDTDFKRQISLWADVKLKKDLREFAFKFYNNILGINTRVSHFVKNHSRACTFCVLSGENPDETFLHLFWECAKIKSQRNKLYAEFFSDLGPDPDTERKFWFGFPPPQTRDKKLASISAIMCQFLIWNFRRKKKVPFFSIVKNDFLTMVKTLYTLNRSLFNNDENFRLSRNWFDYLSAGVH